MGPGGRSPLRTNSLPSSYGRLSTSSSNKMDVGWTQHDRNIKGGEKDRSFSEKEAKLKKRSDIMAAFGGGLYRVPIE